MDIELTKDANRLIAIIYKSYLDKRDNGLSKSSAKMIGSPETIHNSLLPEWTVDDIIDTCRELSRNSLITGLWADDTVFNIRITDTGVYYMENRFKNGAIEVANFLAQFISPQRSNHQT